MTRVFVDSNLFIVFLAGDERNQQARADKLFEKAEKGLVQLVTGPPVLFELTWFLRRITKAPRDLVIGTIEGLLNLPGLVMLDGKTVRRALAISRSHSIEFADAYIAASIEHTADAIATFNTEDFRRARIRCQKF